MLAVALLDRQGGRAGALRLRRVAVTVLAGSSIIVAVDVAGTMSAGVPEREKAHHRLASPRVPWYSGEPQLVGRSAIPAGPRLAARRFVADYTLWNTGRLRVIPARDATTRVLTLIEHGARQAPEAGTDPVGSVQMAQAVPGGYVVTSTVGNFLVGKRASHWLVVSLPGD